MLLLSIAIAACGSTGPPDAAGAVVLSSSDGTTAQLSVSDDSGLLVEARNARPATTGQLVVAEVPDKPDTVLVSWTAAPCQDEPAITIEGSSHASLELLVDPGPFDEEVECPAIGVQFGAHLVFDGVIDPSGIEARLAER